MQQRVGESFFFKSVNSILELLSMLAFTLQKRAVLIFSFFNGKTHNTGIWLYKWIWVTFLVRNEPKLFLKPLSYQGFLRCNILQINHCMDCCFMTKAQQLKVQFSFVCLLSKTLIVQYVLEVQVQTDSGRNNIWLARYLLHSFNITATKFILSINQYWECLVLFWYYIW